MELLKSHRSIRKYSDRDVSPDILDDILECGIRSSNTGNMQLYSIIVTRHQGKKKELAPLHFKQKMVTGAPVVLTICLDINRFKRWCALNDTTTDFNNLLWLLNGVIDSSILAQNICVAAENKGLGICYLGTTLYNAPEIIAVLNLPKGVIPVNTLTIGYPEFIPDLTDRLPLDAILHNETYTDYVDTKIADYYKAKEELESSKYFVSENQKQNLAQVYAEVRYKSADNIFFSNKLRKLLEEQGFL
jgi:nitroreductase